MSKQPVINSKTLLWLRDKLKMIVNFVKLSPLLSWSISNDGKINPEFEESVKEAPKENWDRLGMDDKVIGSLPQWALFVLLCLIVCLNYLSDIARTGITSFTNARLSTNSFPNGAALPFKYAMDGLIYLVDFFAKFGALFPLAVIFYFLIKGWGSKK